MKKYNYYGVRGDYAWHLATDENSLQMKWYKPKLFNQSDVVWCQGPQGGVKVCHIDWHSYERASYQYGYCKKDSKAMKEFAWVKLRAKTLNPA